MIRNKSIIFLMVTLALLLVGGCATLPEDFEKPDSYACTDTDDTLYGKSRRDERAVHPGQSGFLLLGNGLDAFVARAVLAHYAERSIDPQMMWASCMQGMANTARICCAPESDTISMRVRTFSVLA